LPKNPALIAPFDGVISFSEKGKMRFISVLSDYEKITYFIKDKYTCSVKKGESIEKG